MWRDEDQCTWLGIKRGKLRGINLSTDRNVVRCVRPSPMLNNLLCMTPTYCTNGIGWIERQAGRQAGWLVGKIAFEDFLAETE